MSSAVSITLKTKNDTDNSEENILGVYIELSENLEINLNQKARIRKASKRKNTLQG